MREIHEIDVFEDFVSRGCDLRDSVIQGLDLGEVKIDWECINFEGAVFLGCQFPSIAFRERTREMGALIFPKLPRIPYQPYRPRLYSVAELMEGWSETADQSVDKKIYDHFVSHGRHRPNLLEALSQRLHDHAIDDALTDLLEGRLHDGIPKRVVAIMGGHGTPRNDPFYRKVVEVARELTRKGYFIASGGGPGMMEAANLGAWIANEGDETLDWAIDTLSTAPIYSDPGFQAAAQQMLERVPDGCESVAIPTWFYGHEPSNLFSPHIAKYFSNGLREDGLLAIANHGVVFSPGSAGTTQEIFMDASQNHYGTFDYVSPMIFLGKERYGESTGLFETLCRVAEGRQYRSKLGLTDDAAEVVRLIETNPPEPWNG